METGIAEFGAAETGSKSPAWRPSITINGSCAAPLKTASGSPMRPIAMGACIVVRYIHEMGAAVRGVIMCGRDEAVISPVREVTAFISSPSDVMAEPGRAERYGAEPRP